MVPSNYNQLAALTVVVVVVVTTLFVPMQVGAQGSADAGGEWSGTETIDRGENESVLERYGIDREQVSAIDSQRSLPQPLQSGKTQVSAVGAASTTSTPARELPDGTRAALDVLERSSSEATVSPALRAVEGETTVVVQLAELDQTQLSSGDAVTEALKTHASITQRSIESFADAREEVTIQEQFWLTNAMLLEVDTDAVSLDALAARPGVDAVHPNFEVRALDATASQRSENAVAGTTATAGAGVNVTGEFTYGLEQIGVPSAWKETKGEGAQVAVLDTGVDTTNHPNLTPIEGGWAEFSATGEQLDTEPNDGEGHGTHVSGTVVGHQTDDGVHYGVAPNADLLHGKVLNDNGGGTFASVIAGMEWATEHEAGVDVMSMSLGFPGRFSERMIEPVRNARAEGITVVIASGNSGADTSASPGNVYDAFAVGASDENRDIASFSSGDTIDTAEAWGDAAPEEWPDEYVIPNVAAPGVGVLSAKAGGGFEELRGTSMATPHVAGAAALVESANEQATPEAVEDALESTAAKPDGEPAQPDTRYGNGIINASAAVEQVDPDATISVETLIADEGVSVSDVGQITVRTFDGFQATTDTAGTVDLRVPADPAEVVQVTASAFGYEDEFTDVGVSEGEQKNVSLPLFRPEVDAKTIAAPEYVESGTEVRITHKVAHANRYVVGVLESERDRPSNDALTVAGENATFGVGVDLRDRAPVATLNTTIDTGANQFSNFTLEHGFFNVSETSTESTVTKTGPTKVHPAVVTLPEDVDPGVSENEPYTKLQETIDFVVPGTTIELDHPTFEASADIRLTGSDSRVALALNKSLTLRAASGASPTIEVTDTGGSDSTTGVAILGGQTTLSGLAVDGNGANTSVLNAGFGVTVTDSTFTNAETGLTNAGTNLTVTDSQFSDMTSGATFLTGTGAEVRGNTFTDVETGVTSTFPLILPPAEIETLADNEIGGGDELTTGVLVTPLGIIGTIEDNQITVANESGVGVQSSVGILNKTENNTITGGETGIQLSGSLSGLDTQVRDNEISNVSTGINVTTGSFLADFFPTNQTIENNHIEAGGTGIRLADSNQTRLSENDVTGAAIRLTNATNTTGLENEISDADTGLVVTNGSTNTELDASTFDDVADAVSIRNESTNTTVDALITNQNGTVSFGDVDAESTAVETIIGTGLTPPVVDVSGSNATLTVDQIPPATPFAGTGTFLELLANGDSPVLSTNVSYSSSEVTDLNESSLELHTYDGTWTPVADSTVDTDAQVVSGTVTEIGTFAPLDPSTAVPEGDDDGEGAGVPSFQVTGLQPQQASIEAGTTNLPVSATMSNQGDAEGEITPQLRIEELDDPVVQSGDTITLGGGEEQEVEFTADPSVLDNGTYTHKLVAVGANGEIVAEQSGLFTIGGEDDDRDESDDDSSTGNNTDDSNSGGDGSGSEESNSGGGGAIGGNPLPPRNPDDDDSGSEDATDEDPATPTARISINTTEVTATEDIQLSAADSSGNGSDLVSYDWTISSSMEEKQFEGETVTTSLGWDSVTIELTVEAANGEQDTTERTLTVEPAETAENDSSDSSTDSADPDSSTSSTPGFGAIAALLGILLGLGLRRRR